MRDLYRNAVAVIVPSLCQETFSLVTVEAFQQSTPVIARNLGGPAELIRQSGGGITYETEPDLIAALDRLLADRALRDELGLRGYRTYSTEWNTETHLRRYFSIIGEFAAPKALSSFIHAPEL